MFLKTTLLTEGFNMTEQLKRILNDIESHKGDKSRLMEECVQKRLSLSIEQYYKELSQSLSFLQAKDEIRVMKKINKG